jgi:type VI secretion system secreted protein Hcp
MPLPIYAKFDGIEGSCQVKDREGTVQVLAMDHTVEVPVDVKDATATGARRHGSLTLTMNIDKATPNLIESVCKSKAINSVEIDFFQIDEEGKQKKYFQMKLEKSRVTKHRMWFPNVDDKPTESYKHMVDLDLRYEKVTWTWLDGNLEFSDAWKEPAS